MSGTICSSTLATGNGPGTVYLCWRKTKALMASRSARTPALSPLAARRSTSPWSCSLHVAYDAFVYKPSYPSGCSNSVAGFPHADTCTITNERPASTAFSIPAAGGTYIDPQFGYAVQRLTASGFNIAYSGLTAFSATSAYVLVFDGNGAARVYNRATATEVYGPLSGEVNAGSAAWDHADDDRIWYMVEGTIKYWTLSTGTPSVRADYASASGSRPAMSSDHNGRHHRNHI